MVDPKPEPELPSLFTINQDFWAREVMSHIMSCDHSLGRKDMLKFILLFYDPI
jgi:hypothetical protein